MLHQKTQYTILNLVYMTLGLICMVCNLMSTMPFIKIVFLIMQIIFISIQFMYIYKRIKYKEPVIEIIERKVVESTVVDPKKKTSIGLLTL